MKRIFLMKSLLILLCGTLLPPIAWSEPPFQLPALKEVARIQSAILDTSKGRIYLKLFPREAPWHVANFKYLADKGFYKGKTFHLHRPQQIIQGGSPSSDPNGGPGYTLPPEFNAHNHMRGTLGMSRKADAFNPARRSNGSQFHILLAPNSNMDGAFTVFGEVVRGIAIADNLKEGDIIENLQVFIQPQ